MQCLIFAPEFGSPRTDESQLVLGGGIGWVHVAGGQIGQNEDTPSPRTGADSDKV